MPLGPNKFLLTGAELIGLIEVAGVFRIAFQHHQIFIVQHKIRPFVIDGWYDCGKTETLLETNRELLVLKGPPTPAVAPEGTVFVPPVAVDPSAVIERSIIGPYVSIAARAVVREAIVRDSIVNEDAVVEQILLDGSVIGEHALVRGTFRHLNVGDSSEVRMG